jgi:putative nucleotidyltransferase with HDIG domain
MLLEDKRLITKMSSRHGDLNVPYEAVLQGWVYALELRDAETRDHTRRVVQITTALANNLGITPKEIEYYRWGALLHDVGKILIPDSILHKSGPLSGAEKEVIRNHPRHAYEILSPIAMPGPVLDIPHFHHEKWDGTGYPHGLKGTEIPLCARIFAIVDVWDALNSNRPYRKAWEIDLVTKYILGESGKHFDPEIVCAFSALIQEKYF